MRQWIANPIRNKEKVESSNITRYVLKSFLFTLEKNYKKLWIVISCKNTDIWTIMCRDNEILIIFYPTRVSVWYGLQCVPMSCKYLTRRSPFQKVMTQKVRTVLVDLSGTLHVENEEIPGSIEALARQDRDVGQLII